MTTTLPGLVEDMSEQTYHARPELSSTGARTLLRVAAKFDWDRTHPVHRDVFDLGSAVHTLVLGTGWPIVVVEADDWRTNAAKDARTYARAAGQVPMLRKDFDVARDMADAVLMDKVARPIFEMDSLREPSLFATDATHDVAMRARLDVLALEAGLMADLKTADSAANDDFAKTAARYGYQVQEWHYRRTLEQATRVGDYMPGQFLFVVVEKSPPYLVNVIELDAEFAQIGRAQVDRALRLYAECSATNEWPGYGRSDGQPNVVGPPAWLAYNEGMEF